MKNFFIKGTCLALAISVTSIFAPNAGAENIDTKVLSSQKEDIKKDLVKIDTSEAGGGELSVDLTRLNDIQILLDGVPYIIEDRKLVKEETNPIMPLAIDSYNIVLANGSTHRKEKMVYENKIISFNTSGPAETREVTIWSGEILLATLTRASSGVGVTARAGSTGPHYFEVTNYSAATQIWAVSIQF